MIRAHKSRVSHGWQDAWAEEEWEDEWEEDEWEEDEWQEDKAWEEPIAALRPILVSFPGMKMHSRTRNGTDIYKMTSVAEFPTPKAFSEDSWQAGR